MVGIKNKKIVPMLAVSALALNLTSAQAQQEGLQEGIGDLLENPPVTEQVTTEETPNPVTVEPVTSNRTNGIEDRLYLLGENNGSVEISQGPRTYPELVYGNDEIAFDRLSNEAKGFLPEGFYSLHLKRDGEWVPQRRFEYINVNTNGIDRDYRTVIERLTGDNNKSDDIGFLPVPERERQVVRVSNPNSEPTTGPMPLIRNSDREELPTRVISSPTQPSFNTARNNPYCLDVVNLYYGNNLEANGIEVKDGLTAGDLAQLIQGNFNMPTGTYKVEDMAGSFSQDTSRFYVNRGRVSTNAPGHVIPVNGLGGCGDEYSLRFVRDEYKAPQKFIAGPIIDTTYGGNN